MKRLMGIMLLTVVLLLSGCSSTGLFNSVNVTNVELATDNYAIVAKNVTGEASAGYLLGFSGAFRAEMQTLALIRVKGKGLLYREALENLWQNFEEEHGGIEGRHLALVNVRSDFDALNVLGIYTEPRVSIRADVIEFLD